MDRIGNLQAKALTLRSLLEQYAPRDADVKEAFEWISRCSMLSTQAQ